MSKQWSREEREEAFEKVMERARILATRDRNKVKSDPFAWEREIATDLQCELTEAVSIIEQYRHMVRNILGRKPVTNVSELEAQADAFLARNSTLPAAPDMKETTQDVGSKS